MSDQSRKDLEAVRQYQEWRAQMEKQYGKITYGKGALK